MLTCNLGSEGDAAAGRSATTNEKMQIRNTPSSIFLSSQLTAHWLCRAGRVVLLHHFFALDAAMGAEILGAHAVHGVDGVGVLEGERA